MSNVTIDSSKVDELLGKLSPENNRNIIHKALLKGGKYLQSKTIENLRRGQTKSGTLKADSMVKGVKLKSDKDYGEVTVHIMGDYRLKWFEKGNKKDRFTKGHRVTGYLTRRLLKRSGKGGNRGKISAINFFSRARADESGITTSVHSSIEESLKRIGE